MKGLYAVYRKEMSHYFVSPIAYIVVGIFLLLTGFFFTRILDFLIEQAFEMGMQGGGQFGGIDVPSLVVRDFFGVLASLLLFLTPILTMGVYAEERKRGTMELLMTSPVTDTEIVLGKYLALLTLFVIMLLPTMAYSAFTFLHSDPAAPWRVLLCAYLGALLMGGVLLSLGAFFSSLTENQLIAAVLTFGAFLILWVIDFGSRGASTGIGAAAQYLSVVKHYDDFTRGVIDTSSLVYYVSFIFLGLFLTVRSIDSMRWRRA
ncbi:MAG: ABC transporter permease [Candidatus Acidiferrales bacterium]|jgi:ABC-2 type transport system permease protein